MRRLSVSPHRRCQSDRPISLVLSGLALSQGTTRAPRARPSGRAEVGPSENRASEPHSYPSSVRHSPRDKPPWL